MVHPRCILICSIFAGMVLGFSPTDTPRYCTEEIGSTGVVPPLSDAELLLVSSLKQVQVLMRHGARIPWSAKRCWQDYNLSWTDCRVHVVEAPSVSSGQMPPMMQFRKVYDGVGNALGDKCQLGQLLYKGYEQARKIGLRLRNHYIGPERLHLFRSERWDDVDASSVYFQSDDEERTLLTAQSLVLTFFDVSSPSVVDWHTYDDIPPSDHCPGLVTAERDAFRSAAFQRFNATVGKELKLEGDRVFGEQAWSFSNIFDCLMTAVCTNRNLPSMSQTFFDKLIKYSEQVNAYKYTFSDGLYASMFSSEIRAGVVSKLRAAMDSADGGIRFAVRGMHDSDISGMLSVILRDGWDRAWPPYAATLIVELYTPEHGLTLNKTIVKSSDYFVRIHYNGIALNLSCRVCFGTHSVCTNLCFAEDFIRMISAIPTGCDLNETPASDAYSNPEHFSRSYFYFGLLAVIIFTSGVCAGAVFWRHCERYRASTTERFHSVEYSGIQLAAGITGRAQDDD